jgi:hypothetical protein
MFPVTPYQAHSLPRQRVFRCQLGSFTLAASVRLLRRTRRCAPKGGAIREDVNSIKARLTSLDGRLGAVHTDMALLSGRMDRLEGHMTRVDSRLNPTDAPH